MAHLGYQSKEMNAFREMLRENDSLRRKQKRDTEFAGRREIDLNKFCGTKPSLADIEEIALRLKRKAGGIKCRHKDLCSLQIALSFSGEGFGEAFVKIDGALPALIRDLSGQDSTLQLRATYCCANLALDGMNVGLKVAKAAAPYLMTHLKGMNQILLEASLWAVGSLSGSGVPACKVLEVQGIYPQIITIMHRYHPTLHTASPLQENSKTKAQEIRVIEAVLYAAAHCITTGLTNNISSSEIAMLTAAAIPLLDRSDSNFLGRLMYLFFIVSCSEFSEVVFLEANFVDKIVLLMDEILVMETEGYAKSSNNGFSMQILTFIIRILGNICSSERGRLKFESISEVLCPIMNNLMKALPYLPLHLLKETLWFAMQLLKPYATWSNGILQICQCPWNDITVMVNSSLELQAKKMDLGAAVLTTQIR
ncbi:uncharacterized protein [Hetaerina americana]|uniref:uncharacterized protein n=1 Tax=Hetaerina americana TaxID=62018 RepID=UPI003A7F3AAD